MPRISQASSPSSVRPTRLERLSGSPSYIRGSCGWMIGMVSLTVAELGCERPSSARVRGLRPADKGNGTVRLGSAGGTPVLEFVADLEASKCPPGTSGLFLFAVLMPCRAELARTLHWLFENRWRFTAA